MAERVVDFRPPPVPEGNHRCTYLRTHPGSANRIFFIVSIFSTNQKLRPQIWRLMRYVGCKSVEISCLQNTVINLWRSFSGSYSKPKVLDCIFPVWYSRLHKCYWPENMHKPTHSDKMWIKKDKYTANTTRRLLIVKHDKWHSSVITINNRLDFSDNMMYLCSQIQS